jgi:hypothetical protein
MPKFTLIAEHTNLNGTPDGTKVNYEFHCDFLPEVLEHMDLFLRGCGFCPTGTLDYVDEFAETTSDSDFDLQPDWVETPAGMSAGHSEYYFDLDRNAPLSPWPYSTNGDSK